MRAEEFLAIVGASPDPVSPFRLGTIDPAYTTGSPKIIFDGESVASTRTYPHLMAYTPGRRRSGACGACQRRRGDPGAD
jgi:hypothetical protein